MEISSQNVSALYSAFEKTQYRFACIIMGLRKQLEEVPALKEELEETKRELARVKSERDSARFLLTWTGAQLD